VVPDEVIPEMSTVGTCREISTNPSNPECLHFIRSCLAECSDNHQCFEPTHCPRLPRRLLHIGRQNNDVSLHEPADEHGVYAILSYCWGPTLDNLKTTLATLESFEKTIPYAKLPKTVQDAVVITRKLGLQYLWVDALCIIQDSHSDWEVEASKMGGYYENAFVTIAATSSERAAEGLLKDRVGVLPAKPIFFHEKDGKRVKIMTQQRKRVLWPTPLHDLGPLSSRAWTYQEHALSRRMLHFLESELLFECQEKLISEDGNPIGDNQTSLISHFRRTLGTSPQQLWRFSTTAYSQRNLSFVADKLPALSGVASRLQQATGFHYLAGLWKETLLEDLLWTSWGWEEYDKPPLVLEAPSWSWASIHGGVAFQAETTEVLHIYPRILSVTCQSPPGNPFGKCGHGRIEITGPVLEMELIFNGDVDDFGLPSYKLDYDGGSVPLFSPDTSLDETTFLDRGSGATVRTAKRSSEPPVPIAAKVWCMWFFGTDQKPTEMKSFFDEEPLSLHGIVVGRVSGESEVYSRVGTASARDMQLVSQASEQRISLI